MKTYATLQRSLNSNALYDRNVRTEPIFQGFGLKRVGQALQLQALDAFIEQPIKLEDGQTAYHRSNSISLFLEAEKTQSKYGSNALTGFSSAPYTDIDALASSLTDEQLFDACISKYISHHGDVQRFTEAERQDYYNRLRQLNDSFVAARESSVDKSADKSAESSKSE